MSNYFTLTLDTTAPTNPTLSIAGGALYTSSQTVTLSIGTSDATTTNYQMLIWGDVDTTFDSNVQTTSGASTWISYSASKSIKLSSSDGNKNINIQIRDDVYNATTAVTKSISLDTSAPIITISGPDVTKVSTNTGKNIASFSFTANEAFTEYKIKVVNATGADQSTGTTIGTANGSTNTSGVAGNYNGTTPISVQLNAADIKAISSVDGDKIIKVFIKNAAGTWSL